MIIPFMCAVLAAKIVGDSLTASIYDAHTLLSGHAVIEQLPGVRLGSEHAVDVGQLVAAEDTLDVGQPWLLEEVARAASREGAHGSCLLLLHAGEVVGVVNRHRLQRWVDTQCSQLPPGHTASALCTFSSVGVVGLHEEVLDASGLVEHGVAQLTRDALLLTALCLFEQKPEVCYCACFDECAPGCITLLSREGFQRTISEARFPMSKRCEPGGSTTAALSAITRSTRGCSWLFPSRLRGVGEMAFLLTGPEEEGPTLVSGDHEMVPVLLEDPL